MKNAEQRTKPHFERVLFVVGNPNAGKSRLLRSMFTDFRFGMSGQIPKSKIVRTVPLSNERCLAVCFTSPHEMKENPEEFFQKVEHTMQNAWRDYFRFNFACALQPTAAQRMPDVVTICDQFKQRFQPERIRIVQIHPEQSGIRGTLLSSNDVDRLRTLRIEVATVDAHQSATAYPNGLLLADYFDFT